MFIYLLSAALASPCMTLAMLEDDPAMTYGFSPPPTAEDLRDPIPVEGSLLTSEHFALRWGPDGDVDPDHAQRTLDALEIVWERELGQLGYPSPRGVDTWLLNVYIGSTGGGTPEMPFPGAYVTVDSQGYPYIVAGAALVAGFAQGDAIPQSVLAHEFTHTIQRSLGVFGSSLDRWFLEAHASWMVHQVFPEHGGVTAAYVGAFAANPHLSLQHYQPTVEQNIFVLHQYGAEVFLQHISDNVADPILLRDMWTSPSEGEAVTEALQRLFEERGTTLDEVYGSFPQHNIFWDYTFGDVYIDGIERLVATDPDNASPLAAEWSGAGTDWVSIEPDVRPRSLAYNLIRFDNPDEDQLQVGFEGKKYGTNGTKSKWAVQWVYADGEVLELPLDGRDGDWLVDGLDGQGGWLVISQLAVGWDVLESYKYDYQLLAVPAVELDAGQTEEVADCGCSTGALPAGSLWGFGWVAVLMFRRRQTREPVALAVV